MDFDLAPDTEALAELAGRICAERSSPERLAELDAAGQWLDERLHRELADAGVVGIALPEAHGGAGMTFLELHVALEHLGRHAARAPLYETSVLGALPIARHGSDAQRDRWLPEVAAGRALLTGALAEAGPVDPRAPRARAERDGDAYRLTGAKTQVALARQADAIVVSATADDGGGLFLLDPAADGVTLTDQETADGRPRCLLELDHAPAEAIGAPGDAALADLCDHAQAALASLASGVCAGALRLSADYTSQREQFGRPVASFQAVGQRLADAYIDTEAVRLTSLQAAWRLSEGLEATEEVAIAKWWAAEAGHQVLHAAQHVHGGVGIDYEYPLHRYFMLAKQLEFDLGHATRQLQRIGDRLAAPSA